MRFTTFEVIGHRGAAGHAPENTAPSFELALALGVHAIELDVHLSRDGVPVVIHDRTVDRTTDGSGAVEDLDLRELKALDAGGWFAPEYVGERLLTLEEALSLIGDRVPVVIEIKERRRVTQLLDACRGLLSGAEPRRIRFSSFSLEALAAAANAFPDTPREWLVRGHSPSSALQAVGNLKLRRICPSALELDHEWIDAARAAGLGVRAYSIPSGESGQMVSAMRRLVMSGAEGATADFPDVLLTTLKALRDRCVHMENVDN